MRILIAGLPKSGTTILTYRIAAALDDVTIEFEPLEGPDPALADGARHLVTKKLVGHQTDSLAAFAAYDRRIWICRDPRDFLVSQSLYRWHREEVPTPADRAWFDRILERLRAKEADPRSVPFLDLEPADYRATFDHVADLWRAERDDSWLLYPYEDMVAGRYEALEDHLGFRVEPDATVADGLERVVRRKGSGDWRHWFTDADVAHYRAGGLRHYMETFGYDHDDWSLAPRPSLDPAHGSDYAVALFDDHRRSVRSDTVEDDGCSARPDPVEDGVEPTGSASPVSGPIGPTRRVLARLLGRGAPG